MLSASFISGVLRERIALMAPSRRLRLAQARALVERLGPGSPSVLDAGCGDGLLSLALARSHCKWEMLGVDLREDLVRGANLRADARSLKNIRFAQADLTRPLAWSGFDVVLGIECLSEIPDDRRAIASMVGALAPGGLLIVQAPTSDWRPILPGSETTWRLEVRHGYGKEEFIAMLTNAGLEQIEIHPTFRNTVTVAQELSDRIKRSPLPLRAAAFPFLAAAVRLELAGVTWGPHRALLATARRPAASLLGAPLAEETTEAGSVTA